MNDYWIKYQFNMQLNWKEILKTIMGSEKSTCGKKKQMVTSFLKVKQRNILPLVARVLL